MEECKLTKRPCRAAIKESVDKCKNPIVLRNMYQVVELIRKSVDKVEYQELTDIERRKAIIICDVLRLENRETKLVQSFIEGLQGIKIRREK